MGILGVLYIAFVTIVTLVFAIPAMLVAGFAETIFIPVATFIFLFYYANKYSAQNAVLYNVIIQLFVIFTTIAIKSNPGTDDSLSNLDKVASSIFWASVFTMVSAIFFMLYLYDIYKASQKTNNTIKQTENIDIPKQKMCLRCGTYNNLENTICSKCGNKIN